MLHGFYESRPENNERLLFYLSITDSFNYFHKKIATLWIRNNDYISNFVKVQHLTIKNIEKLSSISIDEIKKQVESDAEEKRVKESKHSTINVKEEICAFVQNEWHLTYNDLWMVVLYICPQNPASCAKIRFKNVYDALYANFEPMKSDRGLQELQTGFPDGYNDKINTVKYIIPVIPYNQTQTIIVFGIENKKYKNKDQVYGVNIGPGGDDPHCAYIDLIADMTNPHHFDHLPSESFDIIDSEHIPLRFCWFSPFFKTAFRLLKKDGVLVFSMIDMFNSVKLLHPIDKESFFKTPIQNGFHFVENEQEHQAITSKMSALRVKEWSGICFRKTQDTIQNHQSVNNHENIPVPALTFRNLPDFDMLLSKCTTFFEAVMYCKAADYINTIMESNRYTKDQINQLQNKKISFYKIIKSSVEFDNVDISFPTIDNATREPELFYVFLMKHAENIKQFKELTGSKRGDFDWSIRVKY